MATGEELTALRILITENLRVQRGGGDEVPYIDSGNALTDAQAKQNHVIFGRRGCGKSLLLHHSAKHLDPTVRTVYLNCEDFKRHTFPNVLIEILDSVFAELHDKRVAWFGKKKRIQTIIAEIRNELNQLKAEDDERSESIRETASSTESRSTVAGLGARSGDDIAGADLLFRQKRASDVRTETERQYQRRDAKLEKLNKLLPQIKRKLVEFFELSSSVKAVFIQVDDFYHLKRIDQPHVMDYLHRLCKDLPLFFKVATLRHASVLYADRDGQPTGAQERHDYQPIDVDFTFENFRRTEKQVGEIFNEFGRLAKLEENVTDSLFKGEGFRRLVLAGGGVPRDCLSLFLAALDIVKDGDGRIGKDDVRQLSLTTFDRRIEDLKQDAHRDEQDGLLRGIYAIRAFCMDNKTNVFLIEEKVLREDHQVRQLVYRLLDYRIVHSVASATTHKTRPGIYHIFAIDVGCYANMRKLQGRFNEIDLSDTDAKEQCRSAPIVTPDYLKRLWGSAPENVETALHEDTDAESQPTS